MWDKTLTVATFKPLTHTVFCFNVLLRNLLFRMTFNYQSKLDCRSRTLCKKISQIDDICLSPGQYVLPHLKSQQLLRNRPRNVRKSLKCSTDPKTPDPNLTEVEEWNKEGNFHENMSLILICQWS